MSGMTARLRNADDRLRALVRELAATSDPSVAHRLLVEAIRTGRWLTTREAGGDWNVNTHRIGTLRFLAYLGWKDALDLLKSLPLQHTWPFDASIPARSFGFDPTAFSELGPKNADTIAPTVLSAAAGAACMAVRHLMPKTFDDQQALTLYGDAMLALRCFSGSSREESEASWESLEETRLRLWRFIAANSGVPSRLSSQDRSPMLFAKTYAADAWRMFLGAPARHPSDQSDAHAEAIFDATQALAWECEPDIDMNARPDYGSPEWHALAESHWLRAMRLRRSWSDEYGARTSVRCMRVAKKKIRQDMLPPALVAAGTLVQ